MHSAVRYGWEAAEEETPSNNEHVVLPQARDGMLLTQDRVACYH